MPRSVMQRLSSSRLEGVSRTRNLMNIATTRALSKVPSNPGEGKENLRIMRKTRSPYSCLFVFLQVSKGHTSG